MVIIDTLSASMPGGDENTSTDMGLALNHAMTIGHALDAFVMLVHHTGKDKSRGPRGWSGAVGNVGREVQLVALTGYGSPEDQARAREAGFNEHLVKPASVDALRRLVNQTVHPASDAAERKIGDPLPHGSKPLRPGA